MVLDQREDLILIPRAYIEKVPQWDVSIDPAPDMQKQEDVWSLLASQSSWICELEVC